MRSIHYIKENSIYLFFVLLAFFPTVRILIIGSQTSNSIVEYLVSSLPEIWFLFIFSAGFITFIKHGKLEVHLLDKLLIFYLLYNIIVGTFLAGNVVQSIYAIRLSYLPMCAYFIVSLFYTKKVHWEILIERIFKFFNLVCFIGLVLYFIFPNIQNYFLTIVSHGEIQQYFIIRMTSILWTPVVFSSIVAVSIMYWLYKYLSEGKKWHLVFLAMLFICLFLTVSRGALFAVIIGCCVTALLKFDWKKTLVVIGIKVATFSLVGFYVSNPIQFGQWILVSSGETVGMKEGVTRVELWRQTFKQLEKHPMGLGLGKAGHVAARFYTKSDESASASSTDGWYLKLLVETGYPAIILYIVLMIAFTFKWIQYYRKVGYDFLSFVFVVTVLVSVQNLVSNVLDFYLFSYFYWLLIGIFVHKLKEIKHV